MVRQAGINVLKERLEVGSTKVLRRAVERISCI